MMLFFRTKWLLATATQELLQLNTWNSVLLQEKKLLLDVYFEAYHNCK